MISDEKFQEIIDKTDIVSLVSEYVDLTKKGSGYFGLCPFHEDSSPSFSVSPDKKIAMCMTCKSGGNPITFLKKIKNISYIEAAAELAKKASIQIDVNLKPKAEDKYKKYFDIYQVAQEFYTFNLFSSQAGVNALEYLNKRGIDEDVIKKFGIGLAPNNKDVLTKVLLEKGFLDIDCIEAGLIKNNNGDLYDIFMNRIVFPITNENGSTIAFSGRLFDKNDGPKYVNTMETVIYRKGDNLYNLSNAIQQINKTKKIILCEGQLDVIKVHTTGMTDVVCALGSALTANQVKLIKKYAEHVVLAYDNDNAGVSATKTAINLLQGLKIDVIQMPEGLDPDDFINKNGKDGFINLYNERVNYLEFMYYSFFRGKNIYSLTDVEQIKIEQFNFFNTIKSESLRDKLFNKLSNDLQINFDSLLNDYNKHFNKSHTILNVEKKVDEVKNNKYIKYDRNVALDNACKNLMALLIYDKDLLSVLYEYLKGEKLEKYLPDEYFDIYMTIVYAYNVANPDQHQIIGHFRKSNLITEEFKDIVTILGTYNKKTKIQLMLEDALTKIITVKKETNLRSDNVTGLDQLEAMELKLQMAKDLDKIKCKK